MVRDIRGENGVDAPDVAVCTSHENAVLARGDQRLQNLGHAGVEESVYRFGPGRFREAVQFADGDVTQQDACVGGGLAPNSLVDVPDRHVHWPSSFVSAKHSEGRFVGSYDERGNHRARGQLPLQDVSPTQC